MHFINGINVIIDNYDFFILDIWGVIHDGKSLYPDAIETLKFLKKRGKKICLLSNAPRRANKVAEFLEQMQISNDYYDFIITSGEAVFNNLEINSQNDYKNFGKNYFYIGPKKDIDLIKTLNYTLVNNANEADFAIATGFDNDWSTIEEKKDQIISARKNNLPMICVNPDMIVVRIDGSNMQCAGVIAKEYEKIGGNVIYFGKPFAEIYDIAINYFKKKFDQEIDLNRIIAIGDGPETDIKGANNFKIDSILVLGGILRYQIGINFFESNNKYINNDIKLQLENIFILNKINPKFIISTLKI